MSKNDQIALPLRVVAQKSTDDLDLGVLENGQAYVSARGLASLCGVAPSAIIQQALNWKAGDRTSRLAGMLIKAGIDREALHIQTDGTEHAYIEDVAMTILEYYGFEAQTPNRTAQRNFRTFAKAGLRAFVYGAIGYAPGTQTAPSEFQKFYDRLLLNATPPGYFSVFREMSEMMLTAIRGGLVVDEHTVPDISVGQLWSAHWNSKALESRHGERTRHSHTYPDYFPQAAANKEIEAWIYPLGALGEFRVWLQNEYLPTRYPSYLRGKVSKGTLPASKADALVRQLGPRKLP